MNTNYKHSFSAGSGPEGLAFMELCEAEARRRGMLTGRGEPNISEFLRHCVRYTVAHEKEMAKK